MAVTSCMEILDAARGDVKELSPLFHYWLARSDPNELTSIEVRDALQVAVANGICACELHRVSYDQAGATRKPSAEARAEAEQNRLVAYDASTNSLRYELLTSNRVGSARSAIARGFPVLVGFWMTSAYYALNSDRPVHGSVPAEPSAEGHAVVAVGYDDIQGTLIIEDSRGPSFGSAGCWRLPYDILESSLVIEAWVLRSITYDT